MTKLVSSECERQEGQDASPSARLAAILRAMGMEEDAPSWMHTPLPTFAGKTPVELIGAGRGQELVDRLLANAIGNVGS